MRLGPVGARGVAAALVLVQAAGVGAAGQTARAQGASPEVVATAGVAGPPAGWVLAWSDEFDGPDGALPDPAIWGHDLGDGSAIGLPGWGNLERESYTDLPENAALDGDGHLVITVRTADGSTDCWYGPCEYTSARLLTKGRFEVLHGRLEARIRVPRGSGLWPAFWMLGTDIDQVGWPASGEIDVMEHVGRRPTEILGALHGPGYAGSSSFSRTVDLGVPVADGAHDFAIEWEPGRIVWLFDGVPYQELTEADVAPHDWVFEKPFFLLLNVAVGGSLGGPVGAETAFPATMEVDHVRLYTETQP